jgi:hypothetical protein
MKSGCFWATDQSPLNWQIAATATQPRMNSGLALLSCFPQRRVTFPVGRSISTYLILLSHHGSETLLAAEISADCRRLKDDNVICVRGSIVRRAMLAIGWLNSMSGIAQRFWELNPLSVVYVARLADHERDWIRQRFLRNRMSYNWIGIVVSGGE